MTLPRSILLLFVLVPSIVSCYRDPMIPRHEDDLVEYERMPEIEYPEDNPPSEAAWELGKRLFYEPMLSKDGSVSCASCHLPNLAFSDSTKISFGVEKRPGTRNSLPLFNVAFHPYFTREGGVPTLEMQVLVPIQEEHEFATNILHVAELLRKDSAYQRMSRKAYGRNMDYYVITRALANFERTFISTNSAYDRYFVQDKNSLSEMEKAGMRLFFSDKTNCSSCHSGFNFTNYSFRNNGLYTEYSDKGRMRLTSKSSDLALFKVPSLRNVEVTGPYMHDGSISSLEEVVEHYNSGGKEHPQKSELIRPLNLNEKEKSELVAFLKALTDDDFLNDLRFKRN